jgi:hypothetical protein
MPLANKVSPFTAPNYDLFSPARRSDSRGVILGAPLDGAQAYSPWIGLTTIRELALKHADVVGLVEKTSLDEMLEKASLLQNRVIELEDQLAAAEAKNERIAGLVAEGFKVQRVMGRPKKEGE